MTLGGIVKDFKIDSYILVDKEKVIRFIKKAKYLDVYEYWYDDPENPDINIWIDIEGMGYGWLWANNILTNHFEFFQRLQIRKFALELINKTKSNNKIITYFQDGDICFGFLNNDGDCYIRIRVGEKNLDGNVFG